MTRLSVPPPPRLTPLGLWEPASLPQQVKSTTHQHPAISPINTVCSRDVIGASKRGDKRGDNSKLHSNDDEEGTDWRYY